MTPPAPRDESEPSDEEPISDGGGELRDADLALLEDTKLTDLDDDVFDHEAHIEVLEAIIHDNEPPWQIGLFGTWGSGKSSIVELTFDRIRRGRANAVEPAPETETDSRLTQDDNDTEEGDGAGEDTGLTDSDSAADGDVVQDPDTDEEPQGDGDAPESEAADDATTGEDEVDEEGDAGWWERIRRLDPLYGIQEERDAKSSDDEEPEGQESQESGGDSNNVPSYDFPNTACVQLDAWRHESESIKTGLILDLNESLAADTFWQNHNAPSSLPPTGWQATDNLYNWIDSKRPDLTDTERVPSQDELLNSKDILHTLYDVDDSDERGLLQTITDTTRSYLHQLIIIIPVVGILVLGLGGLYWILDSILGVSGLGSPQIAAVGIGTLVVTAIAKQLVGGSFPGAGPLENPRQNWSGSYEKIFDEVVKAAEANHEATYGEELDQIVISVDDLDRCDSETVYRTLVALKSFMDHEKCIYIIPCDDEALYKHLSDSGGGTYLSDVNTQRDFLAKFFQSQIPIPLPTDKQLEAFTKQKLDELDSSSNRTVADDAIEEIVSQARLQTPRRTLQIINRVYTMVELAERREIESVDPQSEFDIRFLTKLEIIREDYPELYTGIEEGIISLPDIAGRGQDPIRSEIIRKRLAQQLSDSHNLEELSRFLAETHETIKPVDPFVRLIEDADAMISRFDDAFRKGHVESLLTRLKRASYTGGSSGGDDLSANTVNGATQAEYLIKVEDALDEVQTVPEHFTTAVQIIDGFDDLRQEELLDTLWQIVGDEELVAGKDGDSGLYQALRMIEFGSFEPLLAQQDDATLITTLIHRCMEAELTADPVDAAAVNTLFDEIRENQTEIDSADTTELREKFATNILQAKDDGRISEQDFVDLINQSQRDVTTLYSGTLARNVA
ncbi:P-loop NTPase fold protein [Halosegnis longus]|uniref:P-loop NTPase fold protein n=1 Tax=Halosegnis longus TaxID=2216012 RepID=UPI00129EEBAE|nr:P-loop NTPase fold protein [Halosegnis longus]